MAATSPTQPKTKDHRSSPKANNPPPDTSSATRHERLCKICQHPRREDIDDDILRWRSPQDIVYDFDLSDRSTVYRHARATKLLSQRKQNLNPALERVIESVYDAKPSMNAVLKAMAIYARINGNEAYKLGFTEPPKHTVITHITTHGAAAHPDAGMPHATAAANGSLGAPLAAPSANPARSATEGQGFSPAEENVVRSTTQGSPAGAREEVAAVVEPPAPAPEPPDSRTAIEMVPVHFADGPAEVVLQKHPEFKRFAPFASVLIPVMLLGSLLWTALLGPGRTVSAAAVSSTRLSAAASATNFPLPPLRPLLPQPPVFKASGSHFSSLSLRSSPPSTPAFFFSPLVTGRLPLPFFYPPQNLQSKIHNPLKTHAKSIFYSPQKRKFTGARRQDARATT